jgi:chemotaxis protein histidine kinase CheA
MAEDQLRTVIDGLRTRIQAELDAQLDAVTRNYEQTLEQTRRAADEEAEQRSTARAEAVRAEWAARLQAEVAAARSEVERTMVAESMRMRVEVEQAAAESAANVRRAAEADAEQRWAAKIEAQRAEWAARLESEIAAARSEVERMMVAESMRIRVEAEQAAAESASHARRETEQALLLERERGQGDLETERDRARAELEGERRRAQAELEAQRTLGEAQVEEERKRAQADVEAQRKLGEAQVEEERKRAQAELEAERRRAQAELAAGQHRAEGEITRARAAFDVERERTSGLIEDARRSATPAINTSGLLEAVRAIDDAVSVSDVLAASLRGAALEAPRAALFIVNGAELHEWPVPGVPSVHAGRIKVDAPEAGLLGDALRLQEVVTTDDNGGPPAPAFASLPSGRIALAVPFVLAGQPVAVLYADEGPSGEAAAAWQDVVQILGRHASAYVAYLTAVRTAQAMRLVTGADQPAPEQGREPEQDEAQGARRYARLLVSEIKLYNESQVRMGRERRDLAQRLKPEIERARRLYDERIAPSIHSRDVYFQQELVQTLADGDQSLLG